MQDFAAQAALRVDLGYASSMLEHWQVRSQGSTCIALAFTALGGSLLYRATA